MGRNRRIYGNSDEEAITDRRVPLDLAQIAGASTTLIAPTFGLGCERPIHDAIVHQATNRPAVKS